MEDRRLSGLVYAHAGGHQSVNRCTKGAITSKIKHAVIGCKLKHNANEGCNSFASLAGLVLSFIACLILLVIAP